jgi:hypothetical protein
VATEVKRRLYIPGDEEVALLETASIDYFLCLDRSRERTAVVKRTVDALQSLGQAAAHWNLRAVRHWFNNNREPEESVPESASKHSIERCNAMRLTGALNKRLVQARAEGDEWHNRFDLEHEERILEVAQRD